MRLCQPLNALLPVVVIGGLATSVLLVVSMGAPDGGLPGVALGSTLILAVERVVALFAAWMAMVIVVVRALAGDLPTEISGQGLKYADAATAGRAAARTEAALDSLRSEIERLRRTDWKEADTL